MVSPILPGLAGPRRPRRSLQRRADRDVDAGSRRVQRGGSGAGVLAPGQAALQVRPHQTDLADVALIPADHLPPDQLTLWPVRRRSLRPRRVLAGVGRPQRSQPGSRRAGRLGDPRPAAPERRRPRLVGTSRAASRAGDRPGSGGIPQRSVNALRITASSADQAGSIIELACPASCSSTARSSAHSPGR